MKKLMILWTLALSQFTHADPFGLLTYIKVKPGSEKEFISKVSAIIEPSRTEAGNIAWYVQQSTENPTEFVFYTRWKSDEALKAHLSSPPLAKYIDDSKSLLAATPKLVRFNPIDVVKGEELREKILGTWKLEGFTVYSNGEELPFCGEQGKISGRIMYAHDGGMSVSINCTEDENAPAAQYGGHFFYAGDFKVKNNEVVHSITNSSVLGLIGKAQARTIETVDDHKLALTGKFGDGSLRIVWRRD